MAAYVKGVLMALRLVLILEAVATEGTFVLLFSLVSTSGRSACNPSSHSLLSNPASTEMSLRSMRSHLPEFFEGVEPLGLLGTALAHEEALHFSASRLLYFSDSTWVCA
jgi:hypothetical protein